MDAEREPSRPERLDAAVAHPELNVNPLQRVVGKVMTILPSAGIASRVVKDTVTSPTSFAIREAGSTLIVSRGPMVYASG
jgi:hypothetical protein